METTVSDVPEDVPGADTRRLPVVRWLGDVARLVGGDERLSRHAAAVAVGGAVLARRALRVAFVGQAGSGKTTLSTRLAEERPTEDQSTEGRSADPPTARCPREFVELPSLNVDAEFDRAAAAGVRESDVAIMTTQSIAPLGLTETTFLSGQILAGQVPRVAIVLTKLDQVDAQDRDDVAASVAKRVGRVAGHIAVFAGPHRESVADLDLIQDFITSAADPDTLEAAREHSVSRRLLAVLDEVMETMRKVLAETAAQMSADRAAQRTTEAKIDDLDWTNARVDFEQRRADATGELRRRLDPVRELIAGELAEQLSRSADVRRWWEREFAAQLRQALERAAASHGQWLAERVELDILWMDQRLHTLTAGTRQLPVPSGAPVRVADPDLPRVGMVDLNRARLMYQLGPAGAVLAGSLVIPAVGPAVALVAVSATLALGEVTYRNLARAQRERVSAALSQAVNQAVDDLNDALVRHATVAYSRTSDGVNRVHQTWRRDRTASSAPDPTSDAVPSVEPELIRLTGIVDTARHLRDEIANHLSTTPDVAEGLS
jgi:hypothetical protein